MKIVLLSNTPAGGTFWLGSHHLARELARRGHQVAHVSTPVSRFERAIRREAKSGRFWSAPKLSDEKLALSKGNEYIDADGVCHSSPTPLLPARWVPGSMAIQRHLRDIGFADADVALLDQLSLRRVKLNKKCRLIYRPTDTLPPSSRMRAAENAVIATADGIVAASKFTLADVTPNSVRVPTLVLENGVDARFFSFAEQNRRVGVIYVGAIDYRFDWDLVVQAAEELPTERFVLAGPIANLRDKPIPANITLLGPVKYSALPEVLGRAKVGILPLNNAATNQGRSPMKFFEYLASGLFVVARRTPALAERGLVPGASLYESADQAISAIGTYLASKSPNTAGVESARNFEWSARAEILEEFVVRVVRAN